MFKRLLIALLTMAPLHVMAANFVIWHAGAAGGISHNLGVLLKARIESTTQHTVQNRYIAGDGGWLAVRQFVDNGSDNNIHLLVQNADKFLMGELMHRVSGHEKMNQLTPVANLGANPYVILVGTNVKANSIKELDSAGLATITTGSVGAGSFGHLVEHTIDKHINARTASVFYKGGRLALTDLIGNHIHMYSSWPDGIDSAVKGLTRAIAVSQPTPELPGVKTLAEQGITDIPTASTWILLKNQHLTDEQAKLTQTVMKQLFDDAGFKSHWEATIKSMAPTGDPAQLNKLWTDLRATYKQLDTSPAYAAFKKAVAEAK
jgi:tripartite-type tricarboxylate transporter receptor subunit TctC